MQKKTNTLLGSAEYIKARLIDLFISEMDELLIANEVMYGINRKVVDLLVLHNKKLTGIEIKGDHDSLRRLNEQIEAYRKIFHYVIVCTTEIHFEKVMQSIPNDIGIYIIRENEIEKKRIPKLQKQLNKTEMAYTMNSRYLRQISGSEHRNLDSDEIRYFFTKKSLSTLQSILYTYFYSKTESKYKSFLADKGVFTHIDDIPLLSSSMFIQ